MDLDLEGESIRVIVTHLGLRPGERRVQVRIDMPSGWRYIHIHKMKADWSPEDKGQGKELEEGRKEVKGFLKWYRKARRRFSK